MSARGGRGAGCGAGGSRGGASRQGSAWGRARTRDVGAALVVPLGHVQQAVALGEDLRVRGRGRRGGAARTCAGGGPSVRVEASPHVACWAVAFPSTPLPPHHPTPPPPLTSTNAPNGMTLLTRQARCTLPTSGVAVAASSMRTAASASSSVAALMNTWPPSLSICACGGGGGGGVGVGLGGLINQGQRAGGGSNPPQLRDPPPGVRWGGE